MAALLFGGVLAAPLAAYLVRIVPTRIIGVGAGGMIVLTNTRTLLSGFTLPTSWVAGLCTAIGLAWLAVLAHALSHVVRARCTQAAEAPVSSGPRTEPTPV